MALLLVAYFAYLIAMIIATWKIYEKAGQPGWTAIVPFYNVYILLKIIGKPVWWLALLFIPVVNIVFGIWMYNMLSKSFGKDEMTTFLMFLFGIGILQLGFSNAEYQGPYGNPAAFQNYQGMHTFDFEQPAI